MKNNFFDEVLTENALNERFDKILLNDTQYIRLQQEINKIAEDYDLLNLPKEQKCLIDKLIVAYTNLGTYFGKATYKQGFKDCANLFKSLYANTESPYNN